MKLKRTMELPSLTNEDLMRFVGPQDKNLQKMGELFSCQLTLRGNQLIIQAEEGASMDALIQFLEPLLPIIQNTPNFSSRDFEELVHLYKEEKMPQWSERQTIVLTKNSSGKSVIPQTQGQASYAQMLLTSDIVFAIGPAGTGKSFLAVARAVQALRINQVQRIVLTRPAVETGERLGFLPGDLKEKVDPYLRPLYDALYELLGRESTDRLIEKGTIEIAPLAYMRGRTLDHAYIILDEAQNTTVMQMKMFLTRLGMNAKMIITGDITQIDLPSSQQSGLLFAEKVLKGIPDISFAYLDGKDVVRHPLVAKMIAAFSKQT